MLDDFNFTLDMANCGAVLGLGVDLKDPEDKVQIQL